MFGLFLNLFPENIIGVSLVLDIFFTELKYDTTSNERYQYVNSLKFRNSINRSVILPSAYEFENV